MHSSRLSSSGNLSIILLLLVSLIINLALGYFVIIEKTASAPEVSVKPEIEAQKSTSEPLALDWKEYMNAEEKYSISYPLALYKRCMEGNGLHLDTIFEDGVKCNYGQEVPEFTLSVNLHSFGLPSEINDPCWQMRENPFEAQNITGIERSIYYIGADKPECGQANSNFSTTREFEFKKDDKTYYLTFSYDDFDVDGKIKEAIIKSFRAL